MEEFQFKKRLVFLWSVCVCVAGMFSSAAGRVCVQLFCSNFAQLKETGDTRLCVVHVCPGLREKAKLSLTLRQHEKTLSY